MSLALASSVLGKKENRSWQIDCTATGTWISKTTLACTAADVARVEDARRTDKLIVYSSEGHMFIETKHQADRLEQTVAWFDKYLK
jgi:hypothetical protein